MTLTPALPLLVFTDLDGTLLDHDTYSFAPARPALKRLADAKVGVILASSKTAAEIAPLRREMALEAWPAIVENGAGTLPAGAQRAPDTSAYERLLTQLQTLPSPLRTLFTGFGDMTPSDVSKATGLAPIDAARAKVREFSEPGLFSGTPAQRAAFLAALAPFGISARSGGRFMTLSFGATKADQMDEMIRHFAPRFTAALGDAPNDVEMLTRADFGILIPNPHAPAMPPLPGETAGTILRAPRAGPAGWAASMTALLTQLDIK
jgi:mannosyl-3-phosphoglycerate phosphatase